MVKERVRMGILDFIRIHSNAKVYLQLSGNANSWLLVGFTVSDVHESYLLTCGYMISVLL